MLKNEKNREIISYLFFGGLTFLVGTGSFWVCIRLGMNALIANVITWIIAVTFAFFTNKKWVFQSRTEGSASFFKEMSSFFGARLITLAVEELIIYIFITRLHFDEMFVKVAAQVVVIVLNYIFSKLLVFKKK